MKKTLILILMIFYISIIAKAQDIIVKNDKTEIKAKILEFTENEILYKNYDDQQGSTLTILKTAVFMIIYKDGTKEYMDNSTPVVPTKPKTESTPTTNTNNNFETLRNSNDYKSDHYVNPNYWSDKKKQKVSFGIQATTINSTASYDFYGNGITQGRFTNQSVVGYRGGLFFNIPISKNISIEPSLNYVNKGTKLEWVTGTTTKYKYENVLSLNYVEVPILFSYCSGIKTGFIIGLGIVASYGISGKSKYTGTKTVGTTTTTLTPSEYDFVFDGDGNIIDDNEHLKALELGAMAQVGYKISNHFKVCLLYNKSFTNTTADTDGYTSKYETSYMALNLGISF